MCLSDINPIAGDDAAIENDKAIFSIVGTACPTPDFSRIPSGCRRHVAHHAFVVAHSLGKTRN
jgi:hypothetical protein